MSQRDACTEIKGAPFAVLLLVFPTILFHRHKWRFQILHTSECQISANCSVLPSMSFLWLTSFKWLLSCTLCFTWESNSFRLGHTWPMSYCWQKQRHKYSKYQGRHLKFPFLNSDDQNLIYPSLRLSSDGKIRTSFGYRDFLRVFQRFCAAVSVCVNMVPLRPVLPCWPPAPGQLPVQGYLEGSWRRELSGLQASGG